MFKSCGLLIVLGALPLASSASSASSYSSFNAWRDAIQQAGYQLVEIAQTNADALFVNCVSTCVQYDWGKLDNYDNVPRNPREWMQLLPGTPIYGFGTYLQLTDSDRAGLAFASGDPRSGQPVTLLSTLTDSGLYDGFYGLAADQAVTDLYIGYPPRGESGQQTSSGDTFSMDGIFFAVSSKAVLPAPEPAPLQMLGLGLGALAIVALGARLQVIFGRSHSR